MPPCQGCHGADANGIAGPAYATWPKLRGQHAAYIEQQHKAYRDGNLDDASTWFIMRGVAHTLDDAAITAVANYLAALPPAN